MEFKNIKTLETYLLNIMNTRSITLLEKVASEYNLDKNELLNKYVEVNNNTKVNNTEVNNTEVNNTEVNNVEVNNTEVSNIKSNKEIIGDIIDDNFRCIAMTRMNTRCKRSKRNADYCNIHLKKMNIII